MAFATDEITRASFEALGAGPAKSKETKPTKAAPARKAPRGRGKRKSAK